MRQHGETLADLVKHLIEPIDHYAPYHAIVDGKIVNRTWRTRQPSLLDQLAEAVEPAGDNAGGRMPPASRPAARLDAIDRHNAIARETRGWLDAYGIRRRARLADNVRALVGITYRDNDDDRVATAVATWAIWARVVTGWDKPAWAPDVPCTLCGTRGGLRIRLDRRTACCLHCGEAWDETTIVLLAEGIRAVTGAATPPLLVAA